MTLAPLYKHVQLVSFEMVKFTEKPETCNHVSSTEYYDAEGDPVQACTSCGETDPWKLDPSGGML